jgi:hypothetical protein
MFAVEAGVHDTVLGFSKNACQLRLVPQCVGFVAGTVLEFEGPKAPD